MQSKGAHIAALDAIMSEAWEISQRVRKQTRDAEPREILEFCLRYGYSGFPLSGRDFERGWWLDKGRRGGPMTLEDVQHSFAVVLCFSSGPILRGEDRENPLAFGALFRSDRVLVLYDVDLLPSFDTALALLHEARHARHRYGKAFAGLSELDPPELHEDRTWEFMFRILDACGEGYWRRAVETCAGQLEPVLRLRLADQREQSSASCTITYPLALDLPFGFAVHPKCLAVRTALLGARAYKLLADHWGLPEPRRYQEQFRELVGI